MSREKSVLAAKISLALEEQGLKWSDLARKTGITSQSLSKIRGGGGVKYQNLGKIADALEKNLEYFRNSDLLVEQEDHLPSFSERELAKDEEKEIGERIKEIRGKMSQADFAEYCSVNKNTLRAYENGTASPRVSFIQKMVLDGYNSEWLLFGRKPIKKESLSNKSEGLSVKFWNVEFSAGQGSVVVENSPKYEIVTLKKELFKYAKVDYIPKNLQAVRVTGDSMAPRFPNGSLVVFELAPSDKKIKNGKIYALRCEGELFIKQIQTFIGDKQRLRLVSLNPSYATEEIDLTKTADFQIFGEVNGLINFNP